MSSPASATESPVAEEISQLLSAGSMEISPRELHQAAEVAALRPAGSCVYIP